MSEVALKSALETILEVAGMGLVTAGAFIANTAAGLVVAGVCAIALGYLIEAR